MSIVTPYAILSYPHLFKARGIPGNPNAARKFSCVLLFNVNDHGLAALRSAATQAAVEKWGANVPHNMRNPFVLGKDKYPNDPFYADKVLITASSNEDSPPQVLDPARQPILRPSDIYAGCMVVAAVRPFAYDQMGNKGVSFWLNAVMKVGDGEPLGNTFSAEAAFADVKPIAGAPAPVAPAPAANNGAPAGFTF